MCHIKVFLLESNEKQAGYTKHTLTSELSTLYKNHWGLLKILFHKKLPKLNFSSRNFVLLHDRQSSTSTVSDLLHWKPKACKTISIT